MYKRQLLAESPVSLECRVFDINELGSHVMFLADIVAVDVDESLVDREGRLMIERAGPVSYTHLDVYKRQIFRTAVRQVSPG